MLLHNNCSSTSAPEPKQQKLTDVIVHRQKCSKEKTAVINNLLLGVIVRGQRPISIVEDDAVIDLLAYLEPGYKCPGRTFFTSEMETKYNYI